MNLIICLNLNVSCSCVCVCVCVCVCLTVDGLLHPLQSCVGSVHIQSEVVQLLLAQLTVAGLLLQHLTAQDLTTTHSFRRVDATGTTLASSGHPSWPHRGPSDRV